MMTTFFGHNNFTYFLDQNVPDTLKHTYLATKLTYNLQSNTGNGRGSHFEVHAAFIDGLVLVIDVLDGKPCGIVFGQK